LGTDFESSNFDITIYEIEEGSGIDGEDNKLRPLWFFKQPELVRNGILLDDDEVIEYDESVIAEDRSLVDYYFDILTDRDIPDDHICDYLNKENDNNNIYLRDSGVFNVQSDNRACKDKRKNTIDNQYVVRREDDLGNEC
jgi:hypothetical protein